MRKCKQQLSGTAHVLFGHKATLHALRSHSVRSNYSNIWQDSWLAHSTAFYRVKISLGRAWILLKSHTQKRIKLWQMHHTLLRNLSGLWLWLDQRFGCVSWKIEKWALNPGLTTVLMGSCWLFQASFFSFPSFWMQLIELLSLKWKKLPV